MSSRDSSPRIRPSRTNSKLSSAFTQRKLTDFRKSGKKAESDAKAVLKRVRNEEAEEVDLLASVQSEPKVARLDRELVILEKPDSPERLLDDEEPLAAGDNEDGSSAVEIPQRVQDLIADKPAAIQLLKDFDLNYSYGPCVGLSRLERWERAQKLELDPPEDIRLILLTPEAKKDEELREALWHKEL